MKIISAAAVHSLMSFPALIERLKHIFSQPAGVPQRQVFPLDQSSHDAFAVLPAWDQHTIAVKAFTYFPDNPAKSAQLKSLYSQILIFNRTTGEPQALLDGTSITYWRTAAVSALACDYLAKKDASTLLILGTGNLASYMALAHASVRPISHIKVWGRQDEKVAALILKLRQARPTLKITASEDLATDVPWADIISCATGSPSPLFPGHWVAAGTHTDFVGNHHKDCRECDSELVTKANVYVDSCINVFAEAGEILLPIVEGNFALERVKGELSQLCSGDVLGRQNDTDITLFKSVGTALADLAGAQLVYELSER